MTDLDATRTILGRCARKLPAMPKTLIAIFIAASLAGATIPATADAGVRCTYAKGGC